MLSYVIDQYVNAIIAMLKETSFQTEKIRKRDRGGGGRGGVGGAPLPRDDLQVSNETGFLIIGVEVKHETRLKNL